MSQISTFQSRLRNIALTSDQMRVAEVLTSRLHRTAFLTGPELAEECKVSPSAITRFAQKLGYSGFPELKKSLEEQYRKTTTPLEMFESFIQDTGSDSVAGKSLKQDLENVNRMKLTLDRAELHKAVRLIAYAPQIHLAGIGASEILVDYSAAYLEALEKPLHRWKSFGISRKAEVHLFKPGEVIVGFSFQRILKEVRELFQYVKKFNVKTIAITDSPLNPLAREADVVLVTSVIGTTFGLSLVAPMTLINVLINEVAALDQEKSRKSLNKVKEEWERCPIFCDSGAYADEGK